MIDLSSAIEGLYEAFSAYPRNPDMEGCPCCVSADDQHALRGPLRELTGEQLSRFAFKAMTTWGTEEDFKHFLPRMLELRVDDFMVLRKMVSAGWDDWPEEEKQAVRDFLFTCWKEDMSHGSSAYENLVLISGYLEEIRAFAGRVED